MQHSLRSGSALDRTALSIVMLPEIKDQLCTVKSALEHCLKLKNRYKYMPNVGILWDVGG